MVNIRKYKEKSSKESRELDNSCLGREACLKRGQAGIKGIAILWASLDDDRSRTITFEEFQKGIINHNITMTKDEMLQLFKLFDTNNNGSIDFEEFITALRVSNPISLLWLELFYSEVLNILCHLKPPMSNSRVALVSLAFRKLDKNGDGKVTPEDLVGVFNVKKHPKYLNGDWSEKQIIQSFLETFQIGQHRDSTVSQSLHKTLGLGFGSLFYFIFSGDI